jgi:hypothetical protein
MSALRFVRLVLKVALQNGVHFVDVILLYLRSRPLYSTRSVINYSVTVPVLQVAMPDLTTLINK